jgi:hypothetical protein
MTDIAEMFSDLMLGGLGLGLYFMLDIVARRKKSPKFKQIFNEHAGLRDGYYATIIAYFSEDPFYKSLLVLWVVIIAVLGDVPIVADLLPDISSRHVLIFVTGLSSPFLIDKIMILFTKDE